ncbi:MAG: nicotinate (nicotinamide) nucleotide adenylyltransferase [Cyanobacteria bacterium WB6_1B_304]|nr:nicotinate (nicotinamide) nucleotide adenylyltransferase [Cyanobacteria bacterium WB6_1B_304]
MVELTTDRQPSPKKIGIFGGTFDPVHRGHLTLAQVASHQFSLDLVIWVPTGVPFHKNSHGLLTHSPPPSAYENRLSMVQLAIAPHPNFLVSSIEADCNHRSYAIHTFWRLRKSMESQYGPCQWYWLMGLDTFQTLPNWYLSRELIPECTWLVANRTQTMAPVNGLDICQSVVDRLIDQFNPNQPFLRDGDGRIGFYPIRWHLLQLSLPISSTVIRQRYQIGESIGDWVPFQVLDYIKAHGLYPLHG